MATTTVSRIRRWVLALAVMLPSTVAAQALPGFTIERMLPHTPVRNQELSSTCWSFGTISFVESELLRLGRGGVDLSEMAMAWWATMLKAERHVRFEGATVFTPGGQPHDVMRMIRDHGLIPRSAFTGRLPGDSLFDHRMLDTTLLHHVQATVAGGRGVSRGFRDSVAAILARTLGSPPVDFLLDGCRITPRVFADSVLRFQPDAYVEVTSCTHHPYHEAVILETRFNWLHERYFNVPLEEFMAIADSALAHGYSLAWDGDVSEPGWAPEQCMATVMGGGAAIGSVERQKAIDNLGTKVDHVMHVVGTARDARGRKYYVLKNSWGTIGPCHGYIFMSERYFRLKTVAFMVHRDCVSGAQR